MDNTFGKCTKISDAETAVSLGTTEEEAETIYRASLEFDSDDDNKNNKKQYEDLLASFLPRAVRTLDEDFGFPETFLITLTHDKRKLVVKAIEKMIEGL